MPLSLLRRPSARIEPALGERGPRRWARPPGTFERVLEDLVTELEAQHVPHAFLRGVRDFPRVPADARLVILVAPEAAARFERTFEHTCARRGAQIWRRSRTGDRRSYHVHAFEGSGRHAWLDVELRTAATHSGVPFISAQRLLAAGCAVWPRALPRDLAALLDFLEPYLAGGEVDRRALLRLCNVAESRARRLRELLLGLVGERRTSSFLHALRAEDIERLRADLPRFRRALLVRAFVRLPIETVFGALRHRFARRRARREAAWLGERLEAYRSALREHAHDAEALDRRLGELLAGGVT